MQQLINFRFSGNPYSDFAFSQDFKESMERYLVHGLEPGGFATAMLAKDLERALYNADTYNRKIYWGIAMWIREQCPEGSWGSYEAVDNWCKDVNGIRTKWVTWRTLECKDEKNEELEW